MAIALVTNVGARSPSNSQVTTGSVDTTGADCLVATVACWQVGGKSFPTDSKSNIWQQIGFTEDSGPQTRSNLYVSFPSSVGSGHTFSSGANNEYPCICVAAFSGVTRSIHQGNTVSGTSLSPGSLSLAQGVGLLIASLCYVSTTGTVSIDASFSITDQFLLVGSQGFGAALAYRIVSSGGSITPTFSWSGTGGGSALLVGIDEASGGGSGGGGAFVFAG